MNEAVIKNVPSFCRSNSALHGSVTLTEDKFIGFDGNHDPRVAPESIVVSFHFEGSAEEDRWYITGSWETEITLVCTHCCHTMPQRLEGSYHKLRLIDEHENSLEQEEESQECRFDHFDLRDWLLSEILLSVSIAPKHEFHESALDDVMFNNLD